MPFCVQYSFNLKGIIKKEVSITKRIVKFTRSEEKRVKDSCYRDLNVSMRSVKMKVSSRGFLLN